MYLPGDEVLLTVECGDEPDAVQLVVRRQDKTVAYNLAWPPDAVIEQNLDAREEFSATIVIDDQNLKQNAEWLYCWVATFGASVKRKYGRLHIEKPPFEPPESP